MVVFMNNYCQNYSSINSYAYKDKNCTNQLIDYLSAPFRISFGGQAIDLETNEIHKYTTTERTKIAVASIILFPVIIVSVIAFTAKYFSSESKIFSLTKKINELNKGIKLIGPAVKEKWTSFPLKVLYKSDKVEEIEDNKDQIDQAKAQGKIVAVVTHRKDKYIFVVEKDAQISDLTIAMSHHLEGVSIPLSFVGKTLNDDHKFEDYQIKGGSVVQLRTKVMCGYS